MPREEVVAKARDLIAPVLGGATAQKLIDTVIAIETVPNIRALRPLAAEGLDRQRAAPAPSADTLLCPAPPRDRFSARRRSRAA
jgi:hypothetical protein